MTSQFRSSNLFWCQMFCYTIYIFIWLLALLARSPFKLFLSLSLSSFLTALNQKEKNETLSHTYASQVNWRNEQWLCATLAVMMYIHILLFGSVSSSLPFDPISWQKPKSSVHDEENISLSVDSTNHNFFNCDFYPLTLASLMLY